jgi:hypothetical protein
MEEMNLLKFSRQAMVKNLLRRVAFANINYIILFLEPIYLLLLNRACLKPSQVINNKEFQQMTWRPELFDQ